MEHNTWQGGAGRGQSASVTLIVHSADSAQDRSVLGVVPIAGWLAELLNKLEREKARRQ